MDFAPPPHISRSDLVKSHSENPFVNIPPHSKPKFQLLDTYPKMRSELIVASSELNLLITDTLAFLLCIIQQDENPLPPDLALNITPVVGTTIEVTSLPVATWDSVRRRLDHIYRRLSACSKEFNYERLRIFDDNAIISVIDGFFNSLKAIAHRLTHMVNLEDSGSQVVVDEVLRQITSDLQQRLNESNEEGSEAYDYCPQCNMIDDSPISSSSEIHRADYMDQLEELVVNLEQDSEPLQLALIRRDWQKRAVLSDRSATRKSAIFQQENRESYHKKATLKSNAAPSQGISPTGEADSNHQNYTPAKLRRLRSLSQSGSHGLQKRFTRNKRYTLKSTLLDGHMKNIDHTANWIKEQWQHRKDAIHSIDIPSSSSIGVLLTTDPSIIAPRNLSIELEQLKKSITDHEGLPPANESLRSKLDRLKLNLTSCNLPQDIVTTLIAAMPTNEGPLALFSPASRFTKPLRELHAARSLLQSTPKWEVHSKGAHDELIRIIFDQVQEDLIERIILSVSNISTKLSTYLNNGDVSLHLRIPANALKRSVLQLSRVQLSDRLMPLWSGLIPLFQSLATEYAFLSRYLKKSLYGNATATTLLKDQGLDDISPLPPIYFIIYAVEEQGDMSHQQDDIDSSFPFSLRSDPNISRELKKGSTTKLLRY
ncbi:hypothetical protein F4821DRAFT_210464 [Hypoxylon rubiginosum]|uniref:Uncharacterized protein n=1 Tax=Hypoxylon rubiginosum TaxID=110542 RepID=A0ACC0DE39_9PEZI|nr:hypothetical protein F4821DRAFT_210464 [Hypoxylon rubiginosum]